jgi:hypothetical protein
MRRDALLSTVMDAATILGHEMRTKMRKIEPRSDFLANYGHAIERSVVLLTEWYTHFLSGLAGSGLRSTFGEDGVIAVYVKPPSARSGTAQQLLFNGFKVGTNAPRFLFADDRGMTRIEGADDLVTKLPAMFLFHVCRHLAGPEQARDMIADIRARDAAEESSISN